MIRINSISLGLDYSEKTIEKRICRELRISPEEIESFSLLKRSIDARKKSDIHFTATIDVNLNSNENKVLSRSKSKKAVITEPYKYELPKAKKLETRPLIVGFGPAGMFAGLILAQAGANPIIVERGQDCDSRVKSVEGFIKTGRLNTESNIQFGEGGAGTFSDGKLNTGTKDSRARNVLLEFVKHGAPEEILYNAKPHIGTDKLRDVVKNIRKTIISLGGEVLFETKLISVNFKNNKTVSAVVEKHGNKTVIETENIILAIGHSARDTFKMLSDKRIMMEQKPFSVGARIEHLQSAIDKAQFGDFAGHKRLGAAPYKLNVRTAENRGVYTFCMCPGGEVVPASSEENMVCTNGMSEFKRDKTNANSALLVGVNPEDFGAEDVLAGVEFQRRIERNAFISGGGDYFAPVQRVEDFLANRKTVSLGSVIPSYKRGTNFAKADDYLPDFVTNAMREAIVKMDNYLKGFNDPDAILTGAETRSSSPVRILRNPESMESVSIKGLYPCGEGAGYAGGIISAAVDGIKCAEKIFKIEKLP